MAKDRAKKKQDVIAYNKAYEAEKARLEGMTPAQKVAENKAWLNGIVRSELKSLREDFNEATKSKKVNKLS